ncbi:penicillin-binding protein activator, partial [Duganella callida]
GQPELRQAESGARFVNDAAPPSGANTRIALLLPLRSDTLGTAADAVRAGFMAAWERDRDTISVRVVETGDVPQDILSAYARTLDTDDIIVGPLSRPAVAAVAASPLLSKPTIALNSPEGHGMPGAAPLPPNMLAIGLSIEEEARQVAQWANSEQPGGAALVLTTSSAWQRRVAAAFANQWEGKLGRQVRIVELSAPDGYLSDPELVQLRARLRDDLPALLFSAMGADQTRQLRLALASALTTAPDNPIISTADALPPPAPVPTEQFSSLPIYGTSALNPGRNANFPTQDLENVRLLDLPWQVQRDHPAVMVYPHPEQAGGVGGADMARLYALGIDAFRVAREISRHPVGRFQLDGVTGKLNVKFGDGPASFERVEQSAIYKNGAPQPVAIP